MAKLNLILPIITLILFLTTMTQISYARTLSNNPTPTKAHHYNHQNQPKINFLMQNVLNVTQTFPNPKFPIPKIPFPKPRGYFPPKKGIPLPPSFELNYNNNLGMSFMPRAAPQELEFGSVTQIDEHLYEGTTTSLIVGKAKGMFVASSDQNGTSSHSMVAFTASFDNNNNNNNNDGLRFFGVYKREMGESHIAVIGGIGKYEGANGYASIKAIDAANGEQNIINKLLLFNVYLS